MVVLGPNARSFQALLAALINTLAIGCAIPIIGATSHRAGETRNPEAERGRRPQATHARTISAEPPTRARSRAGASGGEACYRALSSAGVVFERVAPRDALGVDTPVQLTGPIRGVDLVASNDRRMHAILDCRLALALLSWAPTLRRAGVVRVEHYSIYRPRARTQREGRVSGHARGLAIDAARFHLDNGAVLDVLTDWEDRERGSSPCPRRPDEAWPSRVLRGVVCQAVESNLFQVVITPHHDRAHENHVHLEIRPEVTWTYVR